MSICIFKKSPWHSFFYTHYFQKAFLSIFGKNEQFEPIQKKRDKESVLKDTLSRYQFFIKAENAIQSTLMIQLIPIARKRNKHTHPNTGCSRAEIRYIWHIKGGTCNIQVRPRHITYKVL